MSHTHNIFDQIMQPYKKHSKGGRFYILNPSPIFDQIFYPNHADFVHAVAS